MSTWAPARGRGLLLSAQVTPASADTALACHLQASLAFPGESTYVQQKEK